MTRLTGRELHAIGRVVANSTLRKCRTQVREFAEWRKSTRVATVIKVEAETLYSGGIVYYGPVIENTCHADAADYHRSMVPLFDLPVGVVHGGHFPSYDCARHKAVTVRNLATAPSRPSRPSFIP